MSDQFPPPASPPLPPLSNRAGTVLPPPDAHAAELRRLELSKARAEAWQAWICSIVIAVAGLLGATLLAVIVLQMAAL